MTEDDASAVEAYAAEALQLRHELLRARAEIDALAQALEHARTIGAAIGIPMATTKVDREAAFEQLVDASQRSGIKVRDLAEYVLYAGTLPSGISIRARSACSDSQPGGTSLRPSATISTGASMLRSTRPIERVAAPTSL